MQRPVAPPTPCIKNFQETRKNAVIVNHFPSILCQVPAIDRYSEKYVAAYDHLCPGRHPPLGFYSSSAGIWVAQE